MGTSLAMPQAAIGLHAFVHRGPEAAVRALGGPPIQESPITRVGKAVIDNRHVVRDASCGVELQLELSTTLLQTLNVFGDLLSTMDIAEDVDDSRLLADRHRPRPTSNFLFEFRVGEPGRVGNLLQVFLDFRVIGDHRASGNDPPFARPLNA